MTQLRRPKHQVLASLVPVKIRNDPLHNDAISSVSLSIRSISFKVCTA